MTVTEAEAQAVLVHKWMPLVQFPTEPPVGHAPFNPYLQVGNLAHPIRNDSLDEFRQALREVVGCSPVSLKKAFEVLDIYRLGRIGKFNFEISMQRDFRWKGSVEELKRIFAMLDISKRGFFTLTDLQTSTGSLA